jgi:hypothetical protein
MSFLPIGLASRLPFPNPQELEGPIIRGLEHLLTPWGNSEPAPTPPPPDVVITAIERLPPRTVSGPLYTGREFLSLLQAAGSDGRIDDREWLKLRGWVRDHATEVTPEVEQMFAALDRIYQDQRPGSGLLGAVNTVSGPFGPYSSGILLQGPELDMAMAIMARLADGDSTTLLDRDGATQLYLELTVDHLNQAAATITPTDASIDRALAALPQGNRPVSAFDLLQVLRAACDYGQITEREWQQISKWVAQNRGRLSPDAQRMFDETAAVIHSVPPQTQFARDTVVLGGADSSRLRAHLERMTTIALQPPIVLPPPSVNPLTNLRDRNSFPDGGLPAPRGWLA